MKNYRTRKELKKEVKKLLNKDLGKALMLYLVIIFLGILSMFSGKIEAKSLLIANYDPFAVYHGYARLLSISGIAGLIFLSLFLSVLFRSLDWLRNNELEFSPFKSNFTYYRNPDWWKLIVIRVIVAIFTFLWMLLLIIPGYIKIFSYSQTFLIYKDVQEKGYGDKYKFTDYITKSRQLMDGNKWRFFVLQLSYIGWYFLGYITFGIALIWVIPYVCMTNVNFYKDLVEQNPDII
ncbi:DUF975 family protein [Companilactobacillus baiquanensis]|uniref:DUF975 family protein n=1 Tax=Companilactobacillus baiquanensis TaxID=2486005 RepID=A0ABW1UUS6_9LACO|nr:DUF975 family protein [Companilactobacillus baiquanensis]